MKPLDFDPRSKLGLLFLCVFSAMLAPDLTFSLALVILIGIFSAVSGRGRYALRGIAAYVLVCLFTLWTMKAMTGTVRTMFVAFLGLFHKVYACGMLAGTLIATTRVNEFLSLPSHRPGGLAVHPGRHGPPGPLPDPLGLPPGPRPNGELHLCAAADGGQQGGG